MALNFTQRRAYRDLVDVWRKTRPDPDPETGKVADGTWELVLSAVPCYYRPTQNDNDPTGVGRVKRRSALTEDSLEMEIGLDLRAGDIVAITPAGGRTRIYERLMSEPQQIPTQGGFHNNCQSIQGFEEEKPNEVVILAHYA